MIRLPVSFKLLVSGIALFLFSNAYAQEATVTTVVEPVTSTPVTTTAVVERHVIVTPVPVAKEVIAIPQGFVNCFSVAAGWTKDVWIPEHKICQYQGSSEGLAWVEGYWACTQYKVSEGICTTWDWKAGHWVKSFEVY